MQEVQRKAIFQGNAAAIAKHNLEADLGLHSFTLALNEFADLTNDEFREKLGFRHQKGFAADSVFTRSAAASVDLPESVDWREKKLVTGVKDQGGCGSCWAFAAVAALEGQHAKKSGKLESFSEQELVDCGSDTGNLGCQGGLMVLAYDHWKKRGGVELESEYPYEGSDNECRFEKSKVKQTVSGYVNVTSGDEEALQEAAATVGPIAVAVDAGSFWWQFYFGGVYTQSGCKTDVEELNHGVTVVGYGSEDGKEYWLIKNSWGSGWGSGGLMKLARNQGNMCGVATAASFPTL